MADPAPPPDGFAAEYFDGAQARARPVRLRLDGDALCIDGDGVRLRVPRRAVQWPERQRHGARQAYLPGGALLHSADGPGWDAWARGAGQRDGLAVRLQQSWRATLAALLATVLALGAAWRWGLPVAADAVAKGLPAALERQLGDAALAQMDGRWLHPSNLPSARAQALRDRLADALRHDPQGLGAVPWRLDLRRASPPAGAASASPPAALRRYANAFALPGGQLIVTDELAELLADRPDVLLGVLGHEVGHLRHRHATRLVVRGTLLAGLAALVVGDTSSLLAVAPAALGQAAYSRDFELQADTEAARLLRAERIPPRVMAELFARLHPAAAPGHPAPDDQAGLAGWVAAFASHPPDAERIARMEAVR